MSFWLHEPKVFLYVRKLKSSVRVVIASFFIVGIIGLWVVLWYVPSEQMFAGHATSVQDIQQIIANLSKKLIKYKQVVLKSNNKSRALLNETRIDLQWTQQIDRLVSSFVVHNLVCQKMDSLDKKRKKGIFSYSLTGRYSDLATFLKTMHQEFSFIQVLSVKIKRLRDYNVGVIMKVRLS